MKKFKILIPCYNDWKSLFKLLEKIDNNIKKISAEFNVLIVSDCSTEKMPEYSFNFTKIKTIDLINIKKNQGHTRCNATAIKYLSEKKDFDYLLLMDGDGEDRPEDLPLIINTALDKIDTSIVARRAKRSEGLIFKLLYQLHKIITIIFTGKNINFGHYSCLTKNDVILLSKQKSLWSNFAGTVKKFVPRLLSIPSVRGLRYFGPSKMPLKGLIVHSLSIISTFKYQVLLRSFFMILLFSVLFFFQKNIAFIFMNLSVLFFCIIILIVSRRESLSELNSSQSRIKDMVNIYTGGL